MAKKDYTLLYVAGAAGLAYLILKKPAAPAPATQPMTSTSQGNLLTQAASLVKSIFVKQQPPVANQDASQIIATQQPSSPQVLPIATDPTTAQLIALDQESIAGFPDGSNAYVVPMIPAGSGFQEIPGTALATICGLGCAACMPPSPILSGVKKFDWTSLIVPGVVIAGGYLLAKNIGLFGGAAASNNTAIAAQTAASNQQSLQQSISQGSPKTLTDAQYNSLATDIFNQGLSMVGQPSSRAQDQIALDFMTCQTTSDVYALKVAFGVKQAGDSFWSTCTWLNFNCTSYDLDSFVKASIDAAHLSQINNYFIGKGINYQI
jgi:hypothetical protein